MARAEEMGKLTRCVEEKRGKNPGSLGNSMDFRGSPLGIVGRGEIYYPLYNTRSLSLSLTIDTLE